MADGRRQVRSFLASVCHLSSAVCRPECRGLLNDNAPAGEGWGVAKGAGDGLLSRDLSIGVPSAL